LVFKLNIFVKTLYSGSRIHVLYFFVEYNKKPPCEKHEGLNILIKNLTSL